MPRLSSKPEDRPMASRCVRASSNFWSSRASCVVQDPLTVRPMSQRRRFVLNAVRQLSGSQDGDCFDARCVNRPQRAATHRRSVCFTQRSKAPASRDMLRTADEKRWPAAKIYLLPDTAVQGPVEAGDFERAGVWPFGHEPKHLALKALGAARGGGSPGDRASLNGEQSGPRRCSLPCLRWSPAWAQ